MGLLFLPLRLGPFQRFPGLFLQALGEAGDQRGELFLEIFLGHRQALVAFGQLLQIAMDGGFRARITHFDTYRIDAGVFATGEDRQSCGLHHRLVHAAASHVFSYDFVLWYVACIYIAYH